MRFLLRLTTTLLFVTGWAMGAAAQPGPPSVDPCTLLTKADVEAAMGKFKADPKSSVEGAVRICEYLLASDSAGLELWLFPKEGLDRARQTAKDFTPVTDLGVEAFQRRNKDVDWLELYVRKGNVTLEVTVRNGPGDVEKAKALARKALMKL